ncbi:hypothetical protein PsYK624_081180 [Phanerochaete sordida]|uniref:Nephrocystin 3-like N-terminal domain-containing protein n=1 Tax=Phanerochaete sordida TaxID=48140 RepID=A0A9P3GBZ0_9APHY|nr:hypothetical protein PsYK624_081180 [Phanerochaete sordida]
MSLSTLGASFFFAQNREYLDSTLSLWTTLAYQVQPEFRSETLSSIMAILRGKEPAIGKMMALFQRGLSTTFPSGSRRKILVIDGFNECKDRRQIPAMLRHLIELVRAFPWLYLFITSRPHPSVMSVLAHASVKDIVHHRHLEYGSGSRAVQRYLKHAMSKTLAYPGFPRKHPLRMRRLIDIVGNDIDIARLAFEFLDSPNNKSSYVQWTHVALSDLSAPPSNRHFLYQNILNLEREHLGHSRIYVVDAILRLVVFEHQKLAPDDLSLYVYPSVSPDEIIAVVDRLRPILQIDMDGRVAPTGLLFRDIFSNGSAAQHHLSEALMDQQLDTTTCFATAFLAFLLNTSAVTDILMKPMPLPAVIEAHPKVKHQALALWPRYLAQALRTSALNAELDDFIPSLPLALYAWVTTFRHLVLAGDAVLASGGNEACQKYESEFFQFTVFVQLWRDGRLQGGPEHAVDISLADLREELILQFRTTTTIRIRLGAENSPSPRAVFSQERDGSFGVARKSNCILDLDIREDDLARYLAIVQELITAMGRDDRLSNDASLAGVLEGTYRIEQ